MNPLAALEQVTPGPGWAAFTDPAQYLRAALVLLLATVSGAILAYHPVNLRRTPTAADLDQRKTLIIYSGVGALIAIICTVAPSMAFVIFGIGGLMRFRTDTGESKATGATIMGTLIGLSWGLGLQLVAVVATAYFFVMLFFLEGRPVHTLTIGGLEVASMTRAADEYRRALTQAGCVVLGHAKSFKKVQMTFLVRLPPRTTVDDTSPKLAAVPEELRGSFDWAE